MQETAENIDTPAIDSYERYEYLKQHIAETAETHDEYEPSAREYFQVQSRFYLYEACKALLSLESMSQDEYQERIKKIADALKI